jgi:hypothetical protein
LYISTNNASLAGSHTVSVKISLTKYSNITATVPLTVDLFTLVPTVNLTNYTYKVNSNPLTFRVPLSYLSPYGSASFTFDHRAQIPGGAPLPSYIEWKEAGQYINFTVDTSDDANVDNITVEISTTVYSDLG